MKSGSSEHPNLDCTPRSAADRVRADGGSGTELDFRCVKRRTLRLTTTVGWMHPFVSEAKASE